MPWSRDRPAMSIPHYQAPSDLQFAPALLRHAPQEGQAFLALKAAAERTDGQIPEKYRELISVAVALSTQCAYCIELHTRQAAAAGATPEEIAEVSFITAALKAGAAVGHGLLAMRLFETARAAELPR